MFFRRGRQVASKEVRNSRYLGGWRRCSERLPLRWGIQTEEYASGMRAADAVKQGCRREQARHRPKRPSPNRYRAPTLCQAGVRCKYPTKRASLSWFNGLTGASRWTGLGDSSCARDAVRRRWFVATATGGKSTARRSARKRHDVIPSGKRDGATK